MPHSRDVETNIRHTQGYAQRKLELPQSPKGLRGPYGALPGRPRSSRGRRKSVGLASILALRTPIPFLSCPPADPGTIKRMCTHSGPERAKLDKDEPQSRRPGRTSPQFAITIHSHCRAVLEGPPAFLPSVCVGKSRAGSANWMRKSSAMSGPHSCSTYSAKVSSRPARAPSRRPSARPFSYHFLVALSTFIVALSPIKRKCSENRLSASSSSSNVVMFSQSTARQPPVGQGDGRVRNRGYWPTTGRRFRAFRWGRAHLPGGFTALPSLDQVRQRGQVAGGVCQLDAKVIGNVGAPLLFHICRQGVQQLRPHAFPPSFCAALCIFSGLPSPQP